MTDRPILFSGPMVRALLEDRKTQTRRVLTRNNVTVHSDSWAGKKKPWGGLRFGEAESRGHCLALPFCHPDDEPTPSDECGIYKLYPVIEEGDRLWVRETVRRAPHLWKYADGTEVPWPGRRDLASRERDVLSGIHMPRTVSRLTLTVTNVKVERLQDISEEDADAEGWPAPGQRATTGIAEIRDAYPIGWYAALWDSLNAKRGLGWETNPWVVAVSFDVAKANIDAA